MFSALLDSVPLEARKIFLVLFCGLLIGLEREEHKDEDTRTYTFGGIRTFPFIGLLGYSVALLTKSQPEALSIGFFAVALLMYASFRHKLEIYKTPGLTSEVSGLLTYLLGALIYQDYYWIAAALTVTGVLLLELKGALEGMAKKLSSAETLTFTKFLVLSVVVLPLLPNAELTEFAINPFKCGLIVVAISGISYGSYLLQRFLGSRGGVLWSAVIGGVYSSTVTTVALAKRSASQKNPALFSGAILAASGMMYFRLGILLAIFSSALRIQLSLGFFVIGAVALICGIFWSNRAGAAKVQAKADPEVKNPLEISAALLFAALFVAMKLGTVLISAHLGNVGIYVLSVITGVTDVDPFIMSLTQSAGKSTPLETAAIAIVIAASSNNLVKGFYAFSFSEKSTGRQALALLGALTLVGLVPLLYLS